MYKPFSVMGGSWHFFTHKIRPFCSRRRLSTDRTYVGSVQVLHCWVSWNIFPRLYSKVAAAVPQLWWLLNMKVDLFLDHTYLYIYIYSYYIIEYYWILLNIIEYEWFFPIWSESHNPAMFQTTNQIRLNLIEYPLPSGYDYD